MNWALVFGFGVLFPTACVAGLFWFIEYGLVGVSLWDSFLWWAYPLFWAGSVIGSVGKIHDYLRDDAIKDAQLEEIQRRRPV